MKIDAAVLCRVKNRLGKNFSVSRNNNDIGIIFIDNLKRFAVLKGFGLIHGNVQLFCAHLDIGRSHYHLSSPRLVGLCKHGTNLMFRICKSLECRYGKIRSTHINYFHIFTCLSAIHFFNFGRSQHSCCNLSKENSLKMVEFVTKGLCKQILAVNNKFVTVSVLSLNLYIIRSYCVTPLAWD